MISMARYVPLAATVPPLTGRSLKNSKNAALGGAPDPSMAIASPDLQSNPSGGSAGTLVITDVLVTITSGTGVGVGTAVTSVTVGTVGDGSTVGVGTVVAATE